MKLNQEFLIHILNVAMIFLWKSKNYNKLIINFKVNKSKEKLMEKENKYQFPKE